MPDYYYCKLFMERALLDALKHGTLREQCKMILLNAMNEKNIVKPRLDPRTRNRAKLVQSIAALTLREERRIQEQLKQLHDSGFGQWKKDMNIFVVHTSHARKGNSKYPPAYDGVNPNYTEEEQGVIVQLLMLFDTPYAAMERTQSMNKAMLKKMDDLNDTLNNKLSESNRMLLDMCGLMRLLLQKPNDHDVKEKIERHLKLVENNG